MSTRPMPTLDFARNRYIAQVRCKRCPGYSAPYGHGGHAAGPGFRRSTCVEIVAVMASHDGSYLSAMTVHGNWINIWHLFNLVGRPVGIDFCAIARMEVR